MDHGCSEVSVVERPTAGRSLNMGTISAGAENNANFNLSLTLRQDTEVRFLPSLSAAFNLVL
jgi:hypothetical protein